MGQHIQSHLHLIPFKFLCRLLAPACEHIVRMVVTMVMIVIMAAAGAVRSMVMVVMVMMLMVVMMMLMVVMMLVFFFEKFQHKIILLLHSIQDLCAVDIIPSRCHDGRLWIMLLNHFKAFCQFFLRHLLGTAKHDRLCVLNLIIEKFTKILHIHFTLLTVNNRRIAV